MVLPVTFKITSVSSRIVGLGTSTTITELVRIFLQGDMRCVENLS